MVPYLYMASAGQPSTNEVVPAVLCVTNAVGLALLVLAVVFLTRALRTPQPPLSSSQAAQAVATAQAEGIAAAEAHAKQAEIEKLRRAASRGDA